MQMSKKNNQGTRRKQHDFDMQREAAARKKVADKAAKTQKKLAAKGTVKKTKKTKGIRLRKNVTVAVCLSLHLIYCRQLSGCVHPEMAA